MPRTTRQLQKAVYLSPELVERWQQSARRNHRSMNAEIIVALEAYLELQERKAVYNKQQEERKRQNVLLRAYGYHWKRFEELTDAQSRTWFHTLYDPEWEPDQPQWVLLT